MRRLNRKFFITFTLLVALAGLSFTQPSKTRTNAQEILLDVPPLPPDGSGEVASISSRISGCTNDWSFVASRI